MLSVFLTTPANSIDVSSVDDFFLMLFAAESFDQDLCDWGPRMRSSAETFFMLVATSCPETDSPNLELLTVSPLCYSCPDPPTVSPAPTMFPIPVPDGDSLRGAFKLYLMDPSPGTEVATLYGWPADAWDVSGVEDFSALFIADEEVQQLAPTFSESLSSWDTSSAKTMRDMFQGGAAFDSDLSNWTVDSVEDMFG